MRAALATTMLLLAGCPAPAATDMGPPGACQFALSLDVVDDAGAWVPLGPMPTGAWLIRGFQGFKYVVVRAHLDRRPAVLRGAVVIDVDGLPERSQPVGTLELDGDGAAFVSEPVAVFFNDDPLPAIAGKVCTLAVTVGQPGCGETATGRVTLDWRPACVQDADGGIACDADGGVVD